MRNYQTFKFTLTRYLNEDSNGIMGVTHCNGAGVRNNTVILPTGKNGVNTVLSLLNNKHYRGELDRETNNKEWQRAYRFSSQVVNRIGECDHYGFYSDGANIRFIFGVRDNIMVVIIVTYCMKGRNNVKGSSVKYCGPHKVSNNSNGTYYTYSFNGKLAFDTEAEVLDKLANKKKRPYDEGFAEKLMLFFDQNGVEFNLARINVIHAFMGVKRGQFESLETNLRNILYESNHELALAGLDHIEDSTLFDEIDQEATKRIQRAESGYSGSQAMLNNRVIAAREETARKIQESQDCLKRYDKMKPGRIYTPEQFAKIKI